MLYVFTGGDAVAVRARARECIDARAVLGARVERLGAEECTPDALRERASSQSLFGADGERDTIVHDALVDLRILELADKGAERIFAGKRGGRPSPQQREINAILIDRGAQQTAAIAAHDLGQRAHLRRRNIAQPQANSHH